jgi:hypothetical protein
MRRRPLADRRRCMGTVRRRTGMRTLLWRTSHALAAHERASRLQRQRSPPVSSKQIPPCPCRIVAQSEARAVMYHPRNCPIPLIAFSAACFRFFPNEINYRPVDCSVEEVESRVQRSGASFGYSEASIYLRNTDLTHRRETDSADEARPAARSARAEEWSFPPINA